jgi:protein gp37
MAKGDDSNDIVLLDLVDWVINVGESGKNKRPFNCDWARIIRDGCKAKGAPFFFKQIDKIKSISGDLIIRQFPI